MDDQIRINELSLSDLKIVLDYCVTQYEYYEKVESKDTSIESEYQQEYNKWQNRAELIDDEIADRVAVIKWPNEQ